MRIVVALGGNALLLRGEKLNAANQRRNVRMAAKQLMPIIDAGHNLIITHGSGPQIGLLALQEFSYQPDDMFPLDTLDAEVAGMIGYVIEQELINVSNGKTQFATILTQIEVDRKDPAFDNPTKPIGPMLSEVDVNMLASENDWSIIKDGEQFRRAVPSPKPRKVIEADAIKLLTDHGVVVICGGGGGIPVFKNENGNLQGVEAVIDKDHSTALIADNLDADMMILLTDIDGVYKNWGEPDALKITSVSPTDLKPEQFAEGSMRPKVEACNNFASKSGRRAVIGSINDVSGILAGNAGTLFELPSS